jgi:putative sterol carrier protein
MSYTTAKEVFDKGMPERFRADAAAGEKVSYLFCIAGGGNYLIKIDDGKLTVDGPKYEGEADLKLKIDESHFLDLANGKEGIQLLFMTGRLHVEGDLPTAMKLVKFFPAA